MNNMFKKICALLLLAGTIVTTNNAETRTQTRRRIARTGKPRTTVRRSSAGNAVRRVRNMQQTLSTTQQLLKQAEMVITSGEFQTRSAAKNTINGLMAELATQKPEVHKAIKQDMDIICKLAARKGSWTNRTLKQQARDALNRIEKMIESMEANAKAAAITASATQAVENNPTPENVAKANQVVQAANAEAKRVSLASRAYGVLTAPFDSERSMLERVFYGAVGVAAIGAIGGATYYYGPSAASQVYEAGKGAYNMSAEDWKNTAYNAPGNFVQGVKNVPGYVQGAASRGWEGSKNLASSGWDKAASWGSWAGSKVGYGAQVAGQQAIVSAAAFAARQTQEEAMRLLNRLDLTDPETYAIYNEAKEKANEAQKAAQMAEAAAQQGNKELATELVKKSQEANNQAANNLEALEAQAE